MQDDSLNMKGISHRMRGGMRNKSMHGIWVGAASKGKWHLACSGGGGGFDGRLYLVAEQMRDGALVLLVDVPAAIDKRVHRAELFED